MANFLEISLLDVRERNLMAFTLDVLSLPLPSSFLEHPIVFMDTKNNHKILDHKLNGTSMTYRHYSRWAEVSVVSVSCSVKVEIWIQRVACEQALGGPRRGFGGAGQT